MVEEKPIKRFVLRHKGHVLSADALELALDEIRAVPNLRVIDQSSPKMLLVESEEAPLQALLRHLAGWVIADESAFRPASRHVRSKL